MSIRTKKVGKSSGLRTIMAQKGARYTIKKKRKYEFSKYVGIFDFMYIIEEKHMYTQKLQCSRLFMAF